MIPRGYYSYLHFKVGKNTTSNYKQNLTLDFLAGDINESLN